MSESLTRLPVDRFPSPPQLSFATLQWVMEEKVAAESEEDGIGGELETCTQEKAMFDVVGEQYRLETVEAAAHAIAKENSFLPARYWLLCEDDNLHDNNAVSVHAVAGEYVYQVGFLPRNDAVEYRRCLQELGQGKNTIEVLGCLTLSKNSSHPNVRLYLPKDFAIQLNSSQLGQPAWLRDPSPVHPRQFEMPDNAGFTDDELRKIHCWHSRQTLSFGLPHHCDIAVSSMRSRRPPPQLDTFILDNEGRMLAASQPNAKNDSHTISVVGAGEPTLPTGPSPNARRPKTKGQVVAEEAIGLSEVSLSRNYEKGDEWCTVEGRILISIVRRSIVSEAQGLELTQFMRLAVNDDKRRNPVIGDIELSMVGPLLTTLARVVCAVRNRADGVTRPTASVQLAKNLSLVARAGTRDVWLPIAAKSVSLELQVGKLVYDLDCGAQMIRSIALAIGWAEKDFQQEVRDAISILITGKHVGW